MLQRKRDPILDIVPIEKLDLSLIHLLDAALEFNIPSSLDPLIGYAGEAGEQLGGNPSALSSGKPERGPQKVISGGTHASHSKPFQALRECRKLRCRRPVTGVAPPERRNAWYSLHC